jgi:hypothetical protein
MVSHFGIEFCARFTPLEAWYGFLPLCRGVKFRGTVWYWLLVLWGKCQIEDGFQVQLDESSPSHVFIKTSLDGKLGGEVHMFIMMHHSVHRSCDEHDLHRLIASGLCGVVMK